MSKLIKKLFTLLLTIVVFAASLFIEGATEIEAVTVLDMKTAVTTDEYGATLIRNEETLEFDDSKDFELGDVIQTGDNQIATIRFDERGVIRIAPLSSITFLSQTEDGYVFKINQGQAWVNNLATSSYLNILAGNALLMPRKASFNVLFDGASVEVGVFSRQVTVGLVKADYQADEVEIFQSEKVINSFLVVEGSKATVSSAKVISNEDILGRLLYSKLIKEFKYSLMDKSLFADNPWISQNLESDRGLLAEIADAKESEITSRGLKYSSLDSVGYSLDRAFSGLSDVLTFTQIKKDERHVQRINDHLLDAEYLLMFERNKEATERLALFTQLVQEDVVNGGDEFRETIFDKMRKEYAELNYVLPIDNLYSAKRELSDLLISQLGHSQPEVIEKVSLIRDYMDYAYQLALVDKLQARLALDQYYQHFTGLMKAESGQLKVISFVISEENQIMDNLFRQYSQFYQDSFFAMKRFVEFELLKLIPEGNEKDEERQTLISTKIDFLKRLQSFFLDESVQLTDARLIVLRLLEEIGDLQPSSDIGVSSLFELRLKDYGVFMKFLYSTNVSTLRSSTPQKEYNKFLAAHKEQVSVQEVINELHGEEPSQPTVSLESIIDDIKLDFATIEIEDLKVGELSGAGQKYVDVSGKIENNSFSLTYDWNKKQISDVRSGNKTIYEGSTRISSLEILFATKEEEVTPPTTPTKPKEESQSEQVAKILIKQKLKQNDVQVEDKNLIIVNLDNKVFQINGANLVSDENIQLAFVYSSNKDEVSGLIVRTPSGDVKVTDKLTLNVLSKSVIQVYEKKSSSGDELT